MVGRSSRVQIPMIKDLLLSREHFQVESQPPLCHLLDLGSTNGTKVNGLRVEKVVLREGDVITAGDSAFLVHYSDGTSDGEPRVTCAGCGARVPVETSENLGMSATTFPFPSSSSSGFARNAMPASSGFRGPAPTI